MNYSARLLPRGIDSRLNRSLLTGETAVGYEISPDGDRITYVVQDAQSGFDELYSNVLSSCPAANFSPKDSLCVENFESVLSFEDQASISTLAQTVTLSKTDRVVTGALLDLRGLRHESSGDLSFKLIAPNGTSIDLTTPDVEGDSVYEGLYRFSDGGADLQNSRVAGANDVVPTTSYAPRSGLEVNSFSKAFEGISADGTWTLEMRDHFSGGDGTLSSWRLILVTEDAPRYYVIPTKNGNAVIIEL